MTEFRLCWLESHIKFLYRILICFLKAHYKLPTAITNIWLLVSYQSHVFYIAVTNIAKPPNILSSTTLVLS